jgi:hypothetical protein
VWNGKNKVKNMAGGEVATNKRRVQPGPGLGLLALSGSLSLFPGQVLVGRAQYGEQIKFFKFQQVDILHSNK